MVKSRVNLHLKTMTVNSKYIFFWSYNARKMVIPTKTITVSILFLKENRRNMSTLTNPCILLKAQ